MPSLFRIHRLSPARLVAFAIGASAFGSFSVVASTEMDAQAGEQSRPALRLSSGFATPPSALRASEAEQDSQSALDTPAPMSLSQALDRAWRTNPQVIEAEQALEATEFDISGARTGYYPFAIFDASQRDDGSTFSSVRFVQPLWNGGLTAAQVDTAKARRTSALAELNFARLNVGLAVAEAYINLVAAETQARQWVGYIASLNRLVDIIQRRADEGVAPDADVQTALTRLRQAEAGLETTRTIIAGNQAQLASLLDFVPTLVWWPEDRHKLTGYELSRVGRAGIEAHPFRQRATALIDQQRAAARASRAALWPEIQLQHRRDVQGVRPGDGDATLLVLQYQSDSGLRGLRASQAEAQRLKSAESRLRSAIREVEAAIAVAKAERASALVQIEVQAAAVASSNALVDSFFRQFEVGRKTWIEVLNASREANETILQAVLADRQFWSANHRLALQSLHWKRLSEQAPYIDVTLDESQGPNP